MSSYNLYINSNGNKYTLYLNNHIYCLKNQKIKVNVKNFYMLNSMYNITSDNNTFDIQRVLAFDGSGSIIKTITIPIGNYSVLTFRDKIKSLFSNIAEIGNNIDIVYNIANNTYTFINYNTTYRYYIKNIKCKKQLGLYVDWQITTSGITGSFINMVDYSQIIVKSDLIYNDLNQDNIQYDELRISQILLFITRQDVEPFKSISYSGDDFNYTLSNTDINSITFNITNERNELINCDNWFLHLNFEIIDDKKDYSFLVIRLMKKILDILDDIKYVLMSIWAKK